MDEIMQLAIYLREGFDAALTYVVDPDDRPPWDELIEDAPPWVELIEDEINDRINKAHRAVLSDVLAVFNLETTMKFAKQKPEATVMDITPATAEEMLETSPGNRRLRGWYVDLLAAAMKRGEWRVTSQGIGFDHLGRLRDAHHRLNACIRAGVSFQSVVVFGMRTDAYEVTDTGILRTYADRLDEDGAVAAVLRLGCQYALSNTRPTVDQMRPIIDAGLGDAARSLTEFCGSRSKYYAAAPMKLAACITIMNGGNADFVLRQYRALCSLDFESMSKSGQSLVRQVDSGRVRANDTREVLARGFRVFDKDRHGVSKIQISDADIDSAVELVRSVLRNSVGEEPNPAKVGAGRTAALTASTKPTAKPTARPPV